MRHLYRNLFHSVKILVKISDKCCPYFWMVDRPLCVSQMKVQRSNLAWKSKFLDLILEFQPKHNGKDTCLKYLISFEEMQTKKKLIKLTLLLVYISYPVWIKLFTLFY